jgi:cold shock CspA family protein
VSDRLRGEVVRISARGYAFLRPHDGRQSDLFLHASECGDWESLAVGTLLEFDEAQDGARFRAVRAVVVGDEPAEQRAEVPKGYVSGRSFGKGS